MTGKVATLALTYESYVETVAIVKWAIREHENDLESLKELQNRRPEFVTHGGTTIADIVETEKKDLEKAKNLLYSLEHDAKWA